MNRKNNIFEEEINNKINKKKKKEKEDIGEQNEDEENSNTEKRSSSKNEEEIRQKKVLIPRKSTPTYLQRPGPGARASSRRLATPGWRQKVEDQPSSSSTSSLGTDTTFASIQMNVMAGGTSGRGDSLGIKSLGSDIVANSCSTAADNSAAVLAGKFENYCKGGGKTIARDWNQIKNEKVSIPGDLGHNLANDHQTGGPNETPSTNITPRAAKSKPEVPEEV